MFPVFTNRFGIKLTPVGCLNTWINSSNTNILLAFKRIMRTGRHCKNLENGQYNGGWTAESKAYSPAPAFHFQCVAIVIESWGKWV